MIDQLVGKLVHLCSPILQHGVPREAPPQFAAHRAYSRPALVSRLLRERNVARFLVAPQGFGKSSVVHEYAETVFGFNQVYWLDCTSPCFLRDLDGESIASGLLDATEPAFLAVFEDVPLLDGARVDAFCALLDTLLDRGCEVIVTCTPLCDAFAAERDRRVLFANDLLLSNDEIDFLRTPAERDETPSNRVPRARRVPACAWGDGQNAAFLCGVLTEELPCQMLAALFVLLCLDSGPLSSVERIAHADAEALSFIAAAHAYVGVDVAQRSFRCAGFPGRRCCRGFCRQVGRCRFRCGRRWGRAACGRRGINAACKRKCRACLRSRASVLACRRAGDMAGRTCARP